jgi:cytochrome P450
MQLAEWTAKYGSVYKIRFLHKWAVVVTDPILVRAVLQNSKTYIPKDRVVYHAMESASDPRLPNLVSASDGEYWKAVRGAWMKCFTSVNLKQVLPVLVELCDKVSHQLTAAAAAGCGTAAVQVNELMDRITLDAVSCVSYGRDFGAVDNKCTRYLELVNSQLRLIHGEMEPPLMKMWHKLFPDKEKAALRAEWNQVNTSYVQTAINNPPGPNTIIGQLLLITDPATNKPLTLDQLKAEMVLAALAGFETTSMGLTWTLGALACHPDVVRELESELASVGLLASAENPAPQQFSWQLLGKLSYLQAVIREGLRLFSPAATGTWRLTTHNDITLRPDLKIPQGIAVGVPLFAFGHDPSIYGPDVEAFRPSRWLNSSSSSSKPLSSSSSRNCSADDVRRANAAAEPAGTEATTSMESISDAVAAVDPTAAAAARPTSAGSSGNSKLQDPWTFSIGPRDCAGQALARMELQVVIATLIGRFHLQLAPDVGGWEGLLGRRMYHTTLQVQGGLPLLFRPRVQT